MDEKIGEIEERLKTYQDLSTHLLYCLSCWFHLIPRDWENYCDTSKGTVNTLGEFSCFCYEEGQDNPG